MTSIRFHIPGPLLPFSGGQRDLVIETAATTVGEALLSLWAAWPGIRDRIVNEQGDVREHVNIFLGNENIRYLQGIESALPTEPDIPPEIWIVPAVSGG